MFKGPMRPGASYAVAVPASGTVTQALSAGCRYVRIAGNQPCLVGFGAATPAIFVAGTQYHPDYFKSDGFTSITAQSANATAGTLYITEMSE